MSNPGVTFRVAWKDRERLEILRQKTGKSLGQILRESLGATERNEETSLAEGWREGYSAGITDGRIEGKGSWAIFYYCWVCQQRVEVIPNSPAHQAIVDAMHRERWGHRICHESRR